MRGSIGSDLFKVIAAAFIGPAVSLGQFVYAPVRTLFTWNWELTVVFAVCLGIFTWVFRRLKIDSVGEKREHVLAFNSKYLSANGIVRVCPLFPSIAKLLLVATIMLCLSYTLSFTHFPPIATRNRMTSVHLAAAFGGSLLFACFCSICLSVADAYRFRNRALFVLALYMSLVVAYRFSIQLDFCEAWQDQRSFWTNAIEKLPDMKEGTIVFVLDHDLQRTRYIASNSWADDLLLRQILTFPKQWKNPPQLFVVDDRWTESVFREGHTLKWAVGWSGGNWDVLQNANVILLEMETGKLMRRFGVINIGGEELELKPLSPEVSRDWQKGPMYSYLIDETRYPRVR
jgi:hypothetical protein